MNLTFGSLVFEAYNSACEDHDGEHNSNCGHKALPSDNQGGAAPETTAKDIRAFRSEIPMQFLQAVSESRIESPD
jgi:hypothetical protein